LVVVGRVALNPQDAEYLKILTNEHTLPLEYRVVSI
jgi:hypothetical protein